MLDASACNTRTKSPVRPFMTLRLKRILLHFGLKYYRRVPWKIEHNHLPLDFVETNEKEGRSLWLSEKKLFSYF